MKTTKLLFAALTGLTLCAQDADTGKTAGAAATTPAAVAAPASETRTNAPDIILPNGEKGIRLNLRGVPLVDVLNYMSEAAGFIINVTPGTDIKGKVDVWSNQPLTKAEAVKLLNTVLNDHDLASILKERTLTIFSRDTGKTKNIKVVKGANPEEIEATDEMVTQIIPVKYANAAALIQNLQPLLAEYAQNGLSANESGNSLLLTATKSDVKRVAEIVSALDTAIASVSEIKVYPLKYADATALVASIKELFAPPSQQQNQNNNRGQFLQQMFGGGGPGGFGGGGFGGGGPGGFGGGGQGGFGGNRGGGGGAGARGNVSATAARVVAVADERSNSLIVAAPSDALPEIDRLIKEIDVEMNDVMEIRLFPLVNADPNEIANQLATLFPDPTSTTSNNGQNRNGFGGPRFGGFGGFGGNRGGNTSSTSERAQKQSRVVSVADPRTSSIIVTASHELMPQIDILIKNLDQRRAKRQIVRVYQVENGDIDQIQQVLRDTFDRSNMSRNTTTTSALQQRSQQNSQNQGQNTTGFGGQGGGGGLGNAFGR